MAILDNAKEVMNLKGSRNKINKYINVNIAIKIQKVTSRPISKSLRTVTQPNPKRTKILRKRTVCVVRSFNGVYLPMFALSLSLSELGQRMEKGRREIADNDKKKIVEMQQVNGADGIERGIKEREVEMREKASTQSLKEKLEESREGEGQEKLQVQGPKDLRSL